MPIVSLVVDGVTRHTLQVLPSRLPSVAVIADVQGALRILTVLKREKAYAFADSYRATHPGVTVLTRDVIESTVHLSFRQRPEVSSA